MLPIIIKWVPRFILWTSRIKIVGLEQFYEEVDKRPSIVMLWHNRIAITPSFLGHYVKRTSTYTSFVSQSRDGEWLARLTESYPGGATIRVPKNDKHESLRKFIKALKKSVVLATPDGPTGPIYTMKPGVILAAQMSKAQIFSFAWSASKYWQLRSWDEMKIPKPFGKITIGFDTPFLVKPKKEASLAEQTQYAEERLRSFTKSLEQSN